MKILNKLSLVLICFLVTSCNNNLIQGKTYYILNCKLDVVGGYMTTLQELEIKFISEKYIEAKETLWSNLGTVLTYKNHPTLGNAKQLYEYTYDEKNGILEIKKLNLLLSLKKSDNGNLIASTGETLYTISIVEIIDSEEAKDRVRKASPISSLAEIFARMLQPETQKEYKPNYNYDSEKDNKQYSDSSLIDSSVVDTDSIKYIL